MKNTYFFALKRGPNMGPKYVGTNILAVFGSAIMWSSILHKGSKASGCTEIDKQQNMSSWATFSPSGDIIQSVLAYTYLAIGQGLLHPI